MRIRPFLSKIKHFVLNSFKTSQNTAHNPDQKALLEKKIKKTDIVSFDIFDTLLTRKVSSPEDLFDIIAEKFNLKNFRENRIKADSLAREEYKRDINIDDIYSILEKHYHLKNPAKIKKYEEELEIALCTPRKDILKLYNKLLSDQKTVILVSDMYLKEKTIAAMLKKCGYENYSKLYLSNNVNARKDTKTIWPVVKKDFPTQKILHLGDNDVSDVATPKELGIDTFKIHSSKELAHNSPLQNCLITPEKSPADSIFWGTITNEYLFNSPFKDTPQIDSLTDLGYLFYGPILESFFSFLAANTKQDDKLLFLAREGYYLQKIYRKYATYNSLTPSDNYYFLASRKATTFANFSSQKDLETFAKNNYYQGSIKNWFKQILDIIIDTDDISITLPNDYEKIKPQIAKELPNIIKKSKDAKKNYLSYIKATVKDLDSSTKIIDLGYSGTIQYELSKMTKKDLTGLYLASSNHVKSYSKNSRLLFLFDTRKNPDYIKIYEYSLILEFLLCAPYGQLIGFKKVRNRSVPIYNNESLSERKTATVKSILAGVDKYLKETANLKKLLPKYNISLTSIYDFYTHCVENNIINQTIKDEFSFTDSFTTDEEKNVFKIINKY